MNHEEGGNTEQSEMDIRAEWAHPGNAAEQKLVHETGDAKMNVTHMKRGTVKIKQEITGYRDCDRDT